MAVAALFQYAVASYNGISDLLVVGIGWLYLERAWEIARQVVANVTGDVAVKHVDVGDKRAHLYCE